MSQQQSTSVQALRRPAETDLPAVAPGFGSLQSFELMQRAAKLLSSSTLVPAAYRSVIEKTDRYGNVTDRRENPSALANAVVALNMAQRMGADPLMVMQNLYIVEGRPSWSSQWIIAAINGCGRFSPLRFDIKSLGEKDVSYVTYVWENKQRREERLSMKINNKVCVAWAIEKETGERLESPAVSIEMAVKEGWYQKNGSKWQTMEEVMLRYRTASFFGKLYAPELLMGLQSVEEAQDIIEASAGPDGTIQVDVDALRASSQQQGAEAKAEAPPKNAEDVELNPPREQAQAQAGGSPAPAAESSAPAYWDADKVLANIQSAKDHDVLQIAADSIQDCDPARQDELTAAYRRRLDDLDGVPHVPEQAQQQPARRRGAAINAE